MFIVLYDVCLCKLTASLPVHRHGWHHLLLGRHPAANESEVPLLRGVDVFPQVVPPHPHCGKEKTHTLLLCVTLMHETLHSQRSTLCHVFPALLSRELYMLLNRISPILAFQT